MPTVVDLVCGMDVDTEMASASSVYRGQMYYFCAPGCKAAFDEDPERYMRSAQDTDALAPSEPATILPVDVAIKTRRSIARMKPDPVSREAIEGMLEATMCAIQNMLLVATSLGLGTYLRTGALIHYAPLLEFLCVPEGRRIAGVIYVGYPDHIPTRRRTPSIIKTTWLD